MPALQRSRRWRGGLALLGVAALLSACTGEEVATPEPTPAAEPTPVATAVPEPTATPTPTPTPTPTATPEPSEDPEQARLDELRATDAFVELAEHDRALSGQWSRFAYTEFTLASDIDGDRAEWTNKAELWDELMPPLRDRCLLAGEVATEPIWNGQIMIPVGITPRWSSTTTEGRGQSLDIVCYVTDGASTQEFWSAALIQTMPDGQGSIRAVMPSFAFDEAHFSTYEERREVLRERLWNWILEQPQS